MIVVVLASFVMTVTAAAALIRQAVAGTLDRRDWEHRCNAPWPDEL